MAACLGAATCWVFAGLAHRMNHRRKLWQCAWTKSQSPWWLKAIRLLLPSPRFLYWPLEDSHSGMLCRRVTGGPLFPQPAGKLKYCSSAKEIYSLGKRILCAPWLHLPSLKTFQAVYLNSSHMIMPHCPRLLLLLVFSFPSADPWVAAAKQPVNTQSFVCFQSQAWCFQHILSFSACRLLSNISGKAACDSSQFLWHFKATHMFNISTTSFPRASCFSCHSSFHAIYIEWVIYGITIVMYGTSQHLHGKSIKNSNSFWLTPPVWMLYLVGNNQKKYFSHSEFYEKAIEADVLSQLFFWLWEEVWVSATRGAGLIWSKWKEMLVETAVPSDVVSGRVALSRMWSWPSPLRAGCKEHRSKWQTSSQTDKAPDKAAAHLPPAASHYFPYAPVHHSVGAPARGVLTMCKPSVNSR